MATPLPADKSRAGGGELDVTSRPRPAPRPPAWLGLESEILDALFFSTEWVIRRKDTISFEIESEATRSHSFDFLIPEGLRPQPGGDKVALVPLGFWWKSPGQYFSVDLQDEAGTTLALPTVTESQTATRAVMFEFAREVLGLENALDMRYSTAFQIQAVIALPREKAFAVYKSVWDKAAQTSDDQVVEEDLENPHFEKQIVMLARKPAFLALLQQCTLASIFLVPVHGEFDRRRVIKLCYSTTAAQIFTPPAEAKWWRRVSSWALHRLGQTPYTVQFANAFIRSHSYHLEATPPDGMRFVNDSRLVVAATREDADTEEVKSTLRYSSPVTPMGRTLHFYERNLTGATHGVMRSLMVVVDDWLDAAIVVAFVTMAVLFGLAINVDDLTSSASQNIVTLAVIAPSIATSIVWRRVHWQVSRLHRWLRNAFGIVGLLSFYVALRVAETPIPSNGTPVGSVKDNLDQVACICWGVLAYAALVFALLMSARFRVANGKRVSRP